ncbi:unnamed protein product [Penicillium roqueforti FM164]|uniref:Genomic scaffold, ProqFM164S03 n=1 Tax=Penicillium roqueforti (strain FM164) TaxID=1365484 RepID=W6QDB2_PENRF|nr:unnamed protein product [Penicillium roqueforti FM164]
MPREKMRGALQRSFLESGNWRLQRAGYNMNGDFALMKTSDAPRIPVTRVECEADKYLVCSSFPVPMRSHAVYYFDRLLVASMMSQYTIHIVYLGPSLSRLCASGLVLMWLPEHIRMRVRPYCGRSHRRFWRTAHYHQYRHKAY